MGAGPSAVWRVARLCLIVGAAAAPLAFCAAAGAHGGPNTHVRAVLDPLPAALVGMRIELHQTIGAQIVVENTTPHTVEVLDPGGMPFLRIGPGGVEGNVASPAWYLTHGPGAVVPAAARVGAAPRWVSASLQPSFGWLDPRLDPALIPLPDWIIRDRQVAWQIPMRVDGTPVLLTGAFRYQPPPAACTARLTSPPEVAPGVRVRLLPGRMPGLMIESSAVRPLLVYGADGEPFLRIDPRGVEANLGSRTWAQSARSASAMRASQRSETADWQRVTAVPRFGWIEPRAAAPADASTIAAPATPLATGATRWHVPMQFGDERVEITGVVTCRPGP